MPILSFGDSATDDFFHGRPTAKARKFPSDIRRRAYGKLDMLNAAVRLEDLTAVPGNRLEPLQGGLAGKHSIRINEQWRVVFVWTDGGADQVSITDYHG